MLPLVFHVLAGKLNITLN